MLTLHPVVGIKHDLCPLGSPPVGEFKLAAGHVVQPLHLLTLPLSLLPEAVHLWVSEHKRLLLYIQLHTFNVYRFR